ncbi:YwiC-like family protein [Paenibacillus sp. DYY-L-2]|uniref:YwiC-like family protein n=1 Tax=Paenibacillus sp. DYY-L-2 TaxID=3447013 RepID=UPI003F502887
MKKGYLPKQHGAWAMLLIPFLSGMFAAQPKWIHALLFAGWLLVYLFSFPLLQLIRTKKKQLYAKPVFFYAALLIPVAAGLLIWEPGLFVWLPLFIPLFIVNCWFAKRNRERAFLNDLAAVIQFCFMVFVAYDIGGGSDRMLAAELFVLNVLYFTGTIFFVKTIIREKNNPRFYRLSIVYHVLLLAISAALFPLAVLIPFGVLLIRAVFTPRTKITVKRCGILEIVYSALVFSTILIVY